MGSHGRASGQKARDHAGVVGVVVCALGAARRGSRSCEGRLGNHGGAPLPCEGRLGNHGGAPLPCDAFFRSAGFAKEKVFGRPHLIGLFATWVDGVAPPKGRFADDLRASTNGPLAVGPTRDLYFRTAPGPKKRSSGRGAPQREAPVPAKVLPGALKPGRNPGWSTSGSTQTGTSPWLEYFQEHSNREIAVI